MLVSVAIAGALTGLLLTGAVLGLAAAFRLMRFPDITVEGSFLMGATVWAALSHAGFPLYVAVTGAVAAGAVCGVTTAVLSDVLRLDRFLAGNLVTAACYSIALLTLGASNVGLFETPSRVAPGLDLANLSLPGALAFAGLIALLAVGFFRTQLGLRSRAAASNPQMFVRTIGATVPYLAAGLAFTNAAAALSGAAFARYQGFVDVGMGQGVLITALAAFAVGETATARLRAPRVVVVAAAAIIGSVLYQWAMAAALTFGLPAAMTKLASAGIVLLFLVAQARRSVPEGAT